MKHEIDIQSLLEWRKEAKVMFASASGTTNKQIYCTCKGYYEVWHNKLIVLVTDEEWRAVETYNSI